MLARGDTRDTRACIDNPNLIPLYDAVQNDEEYREMIICVESGREWGSYKSQPDHPIKRWGRALFEVLNIVRDSARRPLLFRNSYQALVQMLAVRPILKKVDSVHNGKARAIYLAHRSYWCATMKQEIAENCTACTTCKIFTNKPKKEAIIYSDPPPSIGHTVAVDFAVVGHRGAKKKFLVLVNSLSG